MTVLYIAGVRIDDAERYQQLANIVATPDLPIIDDDGNTEVPADNLSAWLAKELGLHPDQLTCHQQQGLAQFIDYFTV